MKIKYFGHSTLEMEVEGTRVLVDPFFTGNPFAESVARADELSPDVILITHAHGDHWGDTETIATRTGALVVANHEIVTYLTHKTGHQNVHGMNIGGSVRFDWGVVTQTYARHSSSFPDGTYGGNPNGYLIESGDNGDNIVYLAGDTGLFAEMDWLGSDHQIDLAFLPIGDCYTMGPKDAVKAAHMVKAGTTVPVHFSTFPPIQVDVNQWEAMMLDAGLKPHVMQPGETLSI